MQNFLSLWLNAGAQITHGGQVQRPRQKLVKSEQNPFEGKKVYVVNSETG